MKKTLIFVGVVAVALLMISSVTAVPHASSKPLVEQIERSEQSVEDPLENIMSQSDFAPYNPRKEKVVSLENKFEQFLNENKLTVSNYKSSNIYNSPEFQNLINKGNGFNNEMQALYDELNGIIDQFSEIWPEELLKETLFNTVEDHFENFILSAEYAEFIDAFEDNTIRPLVEELGEVFDDESEIVENSNNDQSVSPNSISAVGYFAEQILIAICTVVFFIGFCSAGHSQAFQNAMQLILGIILGALVVIPACCILISDVILGNAQAAFEAVLTAVVVVVSAAVELLSIAVYDYGIIGLMIWIIGFMINLNFIPLELFIAFIVAYMEYADCKPGYVLTNLGPLVNEILTQAVQNAKDIYDGIWGSGSGPKNKSRLLLLNQFFERIMKKFKLLEQIFSKCSFNAV